MKRVYFIDEKFLFDGHIVRNKRKGLSFKKKNKKIKRFRNDI